MFRIQKLFENEQTVIVKAEGEITEAELNDWKKEIAAVASSADQQVILELWSISFMSPKAVEALMQCLSENVYLMNCPVYARNVLQTAGLSDRILD